MHATVLLDKWHAGPSQAYRSLELHADFVRGYSLEMTPILLFLFQ